METSTNLLSKKAVEEYQDIYFRVFGEHISFAEASSQGIKLLRLFKIIYRPLPNRLFAKEQS